jgi:hypothetical protein
VLAIPPTTVGRRSDVVLAVRALKDVDGATLESTQDDVQEATEGRRRRREADATTTNAAGDLPEASERRREEGGKTPRIDGEARRRR